MDRIYGLDVGYEVVSQTLDIPGNVLVVCLMPLKF